MASTPQHKYHTLDGIRGVAALFVLTRHAGVFFSPLSFPHSFLAVDIFFALSGFVLASAYNDKLNSGQLAAWGFMKVRVIRLWPLFALASTIGFVLAVAHWAGNRLGGWTLPQIVATYFSSLLMLPSPFVPSLRDSSLYPLNGPSWSLFMELFVNLVYATFARRLSILVLISTMAASGIALIGCAFQNGGLDIGASWSDSLGSIPRVIYAFAAGILVHRLRQTHDLPRRTGPSFLTLALLLVIGIVLGASIPPGAGLYYDVATALILVPLIVLLGSSIEPSGWLSRGFALLGLSSYGVYILQVPMSGLLLRAYKFLGLTASFGAPIAGLAFAAFLFAASLILDRKYDQPIRGLLKAMLEKGNVKLMRRSS